MQVSKPKTPSLRFPIRTHAHTDRYIRTQSPTAIDSIPFHPNIKRDYGAVAVGSVTDPRTRTSAVRPAITGGTCVEQMSPASLTAGRAGEQKRRPPTCHLQTSTHTAPPHNTPKYSSEADTKKINKNSI